jgi:hypothetical protein
MKNTGRHKKNYKAHPVSKFLARNGEKKLLPFQPIRLPDAENNRMFIDSNLSAGKVTPPSWEAQSLPSLGRSCRRRAIAVLELVGSNWDNDNGKCVMCEPRH